MWQKKEWKKPSEDSENEEIIVEIPPGDVIDLHTFNPKDILSVVEEFLEISKDSGFYEVRLIHGKGKGIQRKNIRKLLEKLPYVEDFYDAPPERGHYGATIVILKKNE